MNFITEWGNIAGLAGIALGVFLVLFRSIIKKNIFPKLDQKRAQIVLILLMILIWSFAIFAILIYYQSEGDPGDGSAQLTVYVHGPTSRQEVVLENTGTLIIDFGNDRRTPMIGESGRTNCGEIPGKFLGKKIGIGLKAKGFTLAYPDSQYVMTGEPIYLAVQKDGSLGFIAGVVRSRDGQKALDSVQIVINSDTVVTTNQLGGFEVQLSPLMRVQNEQTPYVITAKRKHYKTESKQYFPNSGKIEIRLTPDGSK